MKRKIEDMSCAEIRAEQERVRAIIQTTKSEYLKTDLKKYELKLNKVLARKKSA